MKDLLGREREIEKTYEDGSFNCPFCHAAVLAPAERCDNPACPASTHAFENPGCEKHFREAIEREERRQAAEATWRRNQQLAMERVAEEHEARRRREHEAMEEARRRGACILCVSKDLSVGREPKFIKHRNGCPRRRR